MYIEFCQNSRRWLTLSWKPFISNFCDPQDQGGGRIGPQSWIIFGEKRGFSLFLSLNVGPWITKQKKYDLSFCVFLNYRHLDRLPLITSGVVRILSMGEGGCGKNFWLRSGYFFLSNFLWSDIPCGVTPGERGRLNHSKYFSMAYFVE